MTAEAPQDPPGFVARTELDKAANDNGYREFKGPGGGWRGWTSTTAPGRVHLAALSDAGPWLLAVDHAGVLAELATAGAPWLGQRPAGTAGALRLDSLGALHRAVLRAYRLARALPEAPLEVFRARTADLPRTTEAERLVVKRVGQDVFREALLDYWNHRCPLTGIEDTALLRASHIVPWARCESDAMRLDAHNGLLLAAHWDAAFDAGLVSFADDGRALASPKLSAAALKALHLAAAPALAGLTDAHRANLAWHRRYRFLAGVAGASR